MKFGISNALACWDVLVQHKYMIILLHVFMFFHIAMSKSSLFFDIAFLYQILEMMAINQDLPELEQLKQEEFNLDIEEQKRMRAQQDKEIQEVRSCMWVKASEK